MDKMTRRQSSRPTCSALATILVVLCSVSLVDGHLGLEKWAALKSGISKSVGYKKFLGLLTSTGLETAIIGMLEEDNTVTLFIPSDAAFTRNAARLKNFGPLRTKKLIQAHITAAYLLPVTLARLPVGFKNIFTLGGTKIEKLANASRPHSNWMRFRPANTTTVSIANVRAALFVTNAGFDEDFGAAYGIDNVLLPKGI